MVSEGHFINSRTIFQVLSTLPLWLFQPQISPVHNFCNSVGVSLCPSQAAHLVVSRGLGNGVSMAVEYVSPFCAHPFMSSIQF